MEKFVTVNLILIILLCSIIHILTAFGIGTDGNESVSACSEAVPAIREIPVVTIILSDKAEAEKEIADKEAQENIKEYAAGSKNRWNIRLTAVEQDMLARIIMLESGGEPDEGQQAVTEVILNRIYSDQFPDTVYEVLSQKTNGRSQFVSWKNRNSESAVPTRRVKQNVEAVLNGETDILPYETVYFSLGQENKNIQCVIGRHVFCNQY